jgi:hypothetical protein
MTRPPKGTGLVRGSEDWDLVKSQIESGQFDISGSIPHRRILDFNIAEEIRPYD